VDDDDDDDDDKDKHESFSVQKRQFQQKRGGREETKRIQVGTVSFAFWTKSSGGGSLIDCVDIFVFGLTAT
jgi:hypothetical protein